MELEEEVFLKTITTKKALAEGIPYQTLVASIIHKYVEGRLHEER